MPLTRVQSWFRRCSLWRSIHWGIHAVNSNDASWSYSTTGSRGRGRSTTRSTTRTSPSANASPPPTLPPVGRKPSAQPAVTRVEHLATGATVQHRFIAGAAGANLPGVLWIDLPAELHAPRFSVLRVPLAKPLEIYRGSGQVVSQAKPAGKLGGIVVWVRRNTCGPCVMMGQDRLVCPHARNAASNRRASLTGLRTVVL